MGRKIFVSYKYADSSVKHLNRVPSYETTTVRDYVDEFQDKLDKTDHIYKGENDGEDLSQFKDSTIESKLRDKIYDSTITVVFISPNMKDAAIEDDQWIPWEVSYSLKEYSRNERTHHTNALIGVVLPDASGSYEYAIRNNQCCCGGCRTLTLAFSFKILQKNLFNRYDANSRICNHGDVVYSGNASYMHLVKWCDFITDIDGAIRIASANQEDKDSFDIQKTI